MKQERKQLEHSFSRLVEQLQHRLIKDYAETVKKFVFSNAILSANHHPAELCQAGKELVNVGYLHGETEPSNFPCDDVCPFIADKIIYIQLNLQASTSQGIIQKFSPALCTWFVFSHSCPEMQRMRWGKRTKWDILEAGPCPSCLAQPINTIVLFVTEITNTLLRMSQVLNRFPVSPVSKMCGFPSFLCCLSSFLKFRETEFANWQICK